MMSIPTIWNVYKLTWYSTLSAIAANTGVTDQIVRAIPGLRPAFSAVEKVRDTAANIIVYTTAE